ncbi:MAG: enoyl-CoA hydratase/isomerase family protein [Phycisphaerales bacterium]|nr:enoyl-CoA hydratase/isomerase family protein [Phycisphaerales bacterium]
MIECSIENKIASIALNRPDKRNAMSPEMLDELQSAIDQLPDDLRAITLTGNGKTFCAGFDLKRCAADPTGETMRSLLSGLSGIVSTLRSKPFPVILGVHGAAVAGGCALLGGADIVLADRNAKLGYPVVKIGVSPAVSAPFMLASITPGAARNRLIDTELINATRAHKIGLVHQLVDSPEHVRSKAQQIAEQLASKPTTGVRATKVWLNEIGAPMTNHAAEGLHASLALAGNDEECTRLAELWGN